MGSTEHYTSFNCREDIAIPKHKNDVMVCSLIYSIFKT